MMNDFLHDAHNRAGRPNPEAGWGLLSQGLTGYDWHGGFYAAPVPARARTSGVLQWFRERRARRELARLNARERRDARLPEPPARRVPRDTLWQRVSTWAMSRVPGDPCPDGTC